MTMEIDGGLQRERLDGTAKENVKRLGMSLEDAQFGNKCRRNTEATD